MFLDATDWLLRSAAAGSAVFGLTCLAMWAARQPALRQRLGEWGTAAAVLVALLAWAPAWLVVPAPWAGEPPQAVAALAVPDAAIEAYQEIRPGPAPAEEPLPHAAAPSGPGDVVVQPLVPVAGVPEATSSKGVSWAVVPCVGPWLAGLYGFVAALVLVRWSWAQLLLTRLLRRAWPAPAGVRRLAEVLTSSGRPVPAVRVSADVGVPLSCGLRRPTIVLPAEFIESASESDLRWALAHELAHLERRDASGALLLGLAQAVYFYCPLFWWVRRQIRLCREYVADAAAAEAGGPVEDYAEFLIRLASAPVVPAQALAITGKPSDLFRRVTMLLQCPLSIQRVCPRRRSLAALAALVAIAVFASGVGLKAETPAGKDDKRPAAGEREAAQQTYTVELQVDDDQPAAPEKRRELEEARKALEEAQKRLQKALGNLKDKHDLLVAPPHDRRWLFLGGEDAPKRSLALRLSGGAGRLGVQVEPVSAVLAEQLNLPADVGVIIHKVVPDTPAAKAGLKDHDILLEFAGKPVPGDVADLTKMVRALKAGQELEAVVIRKGQKQTIKGIVLPEAKAEAPFGVKRPGPTMGFELRKGLGEGPLMGPSFSGSATPGPRSVVTTLFRSGDRFTARHQEGNLIMTLTGTTAEGKARVSEIHVQDGEASHTYPSVDQVPERYRDKVKHLLEMSEKGPTEVEKVPTP